MLSADRTDIHETDVLQNAEILVIDDSQPMREAIQDILASRGYRVNKAADGVEGLEQVKTNPPDLILLDIVMPRMDGYTMLAALSEEYRTQDIPVIILTAKSEPEDKARGVGLAVEDYVTKPFDTEGLLSAVQRVLSGKTYSVCGRGPNGTFLPGRRATEQRLTELLFEDHWTVLLAGPSGRTQVSLFRSALAVRSRAEFVGAWQEREFVLIGNVRTASLEQEWLERAFPECSIGVVRSQSVGEFAEAENIVGAARESIRREE
jgi:twitching motility two-component system response regulator PilH